VSLFFRPDVTRDFLAQHAGSRILDIGCGANKVRTDAVGVDRVPSPGVDIVHDLNAIPWPLSAARSGAIVARHVFEHLDDIPAVMGEIRRLLQPRGEVLIAAPHFSDASSYIDPTHKYHLAAETFVTFCREPMAWFDLGTVYVEIPGRWRNIGYEAYVNRPSERHNALSRQMQRWEAKHCFTRRGGQIFARLKLR